MSYNPYRQDRDELKELLQQYDNLKKGKNFCLKKLKEESLELLEAFKNKNNKNIRIRIY